MPAQAWIALGALVLATIAQLVVGSATIAAAWVFVRVAVAELVKDVSGIKENVGRLEASMNTHTKRRDAELASIRDEVGDLQQSREKTNTGMALLQQAVAGLDQRMEAVEGKVDSGFSKVLAAIKGQK